MSEHDSGCEYKHYDGPSCTCKCKERQLARRLALKDADLLLERDRAEKAEKDLVEAQKMLDLGPLRVLKERAEKSEAQVKMLADTLEAIMAGSKNGLASPVIYEVAKEALAKIKEET